MKKSRQVMLAEPVLGSREKEAVARVLEEGWLTMGPRVRAFEEAFARMHGRDDALATSSCTAALHLALAAFDIGPGDEVLVPSLTFVATANAVRYLGARPVFVDIESPMRPWISLADAERKLSVRTKAVIVVHYAGYVADMRAWRAFADAYGLWLVEDAAHAPESAGKDGLADASAYSFFSNKNMTTAEGGMLLMRDPERLARARCMRSHGMTTLTWDRHQGHAYSY
ncbi:MAG: DegT/DnrJ/EryC1/StrS aminotransferase family protein, partial [Zetaproteobacteria bacterium]